MAHTRRTLSLTKKWDLELDTSGNIKLAEGANATAQNVANEARLFTDDAYFSVDKGTPYFASSLGQRPNEAIVRSYLHDSAMRVQDVQEILTIKLDTIEEKKERKLKGNIQFTTKEDMDNVTVSI